MHLSRLAPVLDFTQPSTSSDLLNRLRELLRDVSNTVVEFNMLLETAERLKIVIEPENRIESSASFENLNKLLIRVQEFAKQLAYLEKSESPSPTETDSIAVEIGTMEDRYVKYKYRLTFLRRFLIEKLKEYPLEYQKFLERFSE